MGKPLIIRTYPDEILRTATEEVKNIDGRLQETIERMGDTMYAAPGVGLAAIQVGIKERFLVYDISPAEDGRQLDALINPRIEESEGSILSEGEGCLSVPDYRADVKRSERVLVKGYDRHGNPLEIEAEGFLAIVLQHEIDHLDGTLFIDRISALKREMYKRRVKKQMRAKADA